MEWIVKDGESGLKLVEFIKLKLNSISSRRIKQNIEANGCKINGRVERFASTLVGAGDQIIFLMSEQKKEAGSVLFEDENLFIFDKPSGIASDDPQLMQKLQGMAGAPLFLLHRLDKETSGVLLLAKTPAMNKKMLDLFKQRKINKVYYALVDGVPIANQGVIENYLGKVRAYSGQSIWSAVEKSKGLPAKTLWKKIKKGKDAALLECKPITGRTHQIRVHLSEMGHPILGDYQYGKKFRCTYQPRRCLLHCVQVFFEDPIKGLEINIKSNLPEDMEKAINALVR